MSSQSRAERYVVVVLDLPDGSDGTPDPDEQAELIADLLRTVLPGTMDGDFTARTVLPGDHVSDDVVLQLLDENEEPTGIYPCFHVDASNGMTYGVAAHTEAAAKIFVNRRLHDEWHEDHGDWSRPPQAIKAVKVDEWSAAYGTTLCYGATL